MADTKVQLLPLTGMRFFLALWVVIFHQPFFRGFGWMESFPKPFPSLFHAGYMAVGAFFLLSGFVLSYSYKLANTWSAVDVRRFAVARFARIYPAYCLGLSLSAPWVAVELFRHLSPNRVLTEFGTAVLTWGLMQAWVPQTANAWNNPGWSLSVEAFFYLCFPILGVALWRLCRVQSLIAAGLLIWLASVVVPLIAAGLPLNDAGGLPGALWNRSSTGDWVKFVKYNPLFHLPQFAMGIVIGRAYDLLCSRKSILLGRGSWLYVPALLIEVLAIASFQPTLYPFLHNGLLLPLHAAVVLGLALGGGILSSALSTRPLVLLGNASYSMYIFHGVIGDWMALLERRVFHTALTGSLVTFVYIAIVICLSTAIFKLVEEPACAALKKKFAPWISPFGSRSSTAVTQAC